MNETNDNQTENSMPIYGLEINDGENAPFAELYLYLFPECYEVE